VALLAPSTEEQFGNVVGEATSLGIPVLVSKNAGAVDRLVSDFANGFALSVDDLDSWVYAMDYVCGDEQRWDRLSAYSTELALKNWDSANFRRGCLSLINSGNREPLNSQ